MYCLCIFLVYLALILARPFVFLAKFFLTLSSLILNFLISLVSAPTFLFVSLLWICIIYAVVQFRVSDTPTVCLDPRRETMSDAESVRAQRVAEYWASEKRKEMEAASGLVRQDRRGGCYGSSLLL